MAGWLGLYATEFGKPILPHLWPHLLLWRYLDQCKLGAYSCPLYKRVSWSDLSGWNSNSNNIFLNCRRSAQSIWAHLGKVNRKSPTGGLVVQIYRFAFITAGSLGCDKSFVPLSISARWSIPIISHFVLGTTFHFWGCTEGWIWTARLTSTRSVGQQGLQQVAFRYEDTREKSQIVIPFQ